MPGGGGGGALDGSFSAGVPLSPSNAEPVEDKMILSFRFPVFVTQSPTQLFPVLGEGVNTIRCSLTGRRS